MTQLYLGLMSGTSMDGVDAVLAEFDGPRFARVHAARHQPYADALRAALLHLQREQPPLTLAQLATLDVGVAEAFAAAARALLHETRHDAADVAALGSHGQTVFHDPAGVRSSLQLGDPSLIAARSGITTVADFRRADVARGGQGAPLVPAFHHAVFAREGAPRCVVNIGGIANLTVLPGADAAGVRGFDTGPGNGLLDEWAQQHLAERMDRGGAWAASGRVHAALLGALLADPWFARPPPKSTGRGEFNLGWVQRRHAAVAQLDPADVQRTFCELTARSVAAAIGEHAPGARQVYVCGGGAFNDFLMARLRERLAGIEVLDTAVLGLAPDHVEAAAFAWLAMRTLNGWPGNVPAVTGASAAAVLGGVYRA